MLVVVTVKTSEIDGADFIRSSTCVCRRRPNLCHLLNSANPSCGTAATAGSCATIRVVAKDDLATRQLRCNHTLTTPEIIITVFPRPHFGSLPFHHSRKQHIRMEFLLRTYDRVIMYLRPHHPPSLEHMRLGPDKHNENPLMVTLWIVYFHFLQSSLPRHVHRFSSSRGIASSQTCPGGNTSKLKCPIWQRWGSLRCGYHHQIKQ